MATKTIKQTEKEVSNNEEMSTEDAINALYQRLVAVEQLVALLQHHEHGVDGKPVGRL